MSDVIIKALSLKVLEENRGQLNGLPANPRFIRDEKFQRLVRSIDGNPDMLALRELLVYPLPGDGKQKYIIIGGNMRYRALKELGAKDAPCKIIPKSATIDQLKAYTIKDNASFGKDDMNMLANEWDRDELIEWGMDVIAAWSDETKEQDFGNSNNEINVDEFEEDMTLKVQFTFEQMEWVKNKLSQIDENMNVALLKAAGWAE